MASCYKIEILNPPSTFPESLSDNGRVYLEIGENDLLLAKDLEELTNVDTLKIEGILGFSVDQTKVNKLLLDRYVDPTIANNNLDPIEIRLWKGSRIMSQKWLYVMSRDDNACKYSVRVAYNNDHWAIELKNMSVCDVYQDTQFEFSKANIQDNQLNNWQYIDGQSGIIFPFVHYGGLHSNHFTISDLRPWISQTHLLKTALCMNGWSLKAPILETDFFRKIALYLSGNSYGRSNLQSYKVVASTNGWVTVNNASLPRIGITFSDVVSGSGYIFTDLASLPIGGSAINHNTIFDFCLTGFARKNNGDALFGIQIIKVRADGTEQQLSALSYSFESGQETEIGTYLDNISLLQGEKLKVIYSSGTDTELNLRLETKPKRIIYVEGDIVNIGDLLNCDISVWDCLRGALHVFKGKIVTDFHTKCITIKPPYSVIVGNEIVEGFYNDAEPIDITDQIICDSLKSVAPDYNKDRYCRLGFKDSTDSYINSLEEDDSQVFDKLIDNGATFNESYKENRNPLYEPTLMNEFSGVGFTSTPPHLPVLHDNDDGNISFDLGPRMLIMTPATIQVYQNGLPAPLNYCGELLNNFVTGYQCVNDENFEFFGLPESLNEYLVYGQKDNDFWNKYHQLEVIRRNNVPRYQLDFLICDSDYFFFDFTQSICFNYKGKPIVMLGEALIYKSCSHRATIAGYPELQRTDICISDPISQACQNFPIILCDYDEDTNCYTFTIGGTNESPISTIAYEYQYQNPDGSYPASWTQLTGNQICNPTTIFRIRALVSYGDLDGLSCPDKYTNVLLKDPCGNNPVLVFDCVVIDGENCFTINMEGTYNGTPDVIDIQITLDGGTPQSYVEGTQICGDFKDVCVVNASVSWIGTCPDTELNTPCKSFEQEETDCPDVSIGLDAECVNDCWTFLQAGDDLSIYDIDDYFIYQCFIDGLWTTPVRWDGNPVCCDRIRVKRIVLFCASDCIECTEWIEFEKQNDCQCSAVIECDSCIGYLTEDCGYTWDWYNLSSDTDPNMQPNYTAAQLIVIGEFASGSSGIQFGNEDNWYAVLGMKDGCPDVILYYFHDALQAGSTITTPINV